MTDTLNDVAAAKKREPVELDEQGVAEQLVAQARAKGIDLVGPDGLLSQLTKRVLEAALEEELAEYLGCHKHDPVGRNRASSREGSGRRRCWFRADRDRPCRDRGPLTLPLVGLGTTNRRSGTWAS